MTVQSYVNNVLEVPVTRIGNKYIVMCIEIVRDFEVQRFYPYLSEVTGKTKKQLEKSIRDAKIHSLSYMDPDVRHDMFYQKDLGKMSNTEFIILAAQYYKEKYEDKDKG